MKKFLQTLRFLNIFRYLLTQGNSDNTIKVVEKSKNLTNLLERMGPAYVKIGQILSMRYDLIPKQACQQLQKLLDSGTPLPFNEIEKRIKEDLEDKAEVLLKNMDKEPLAVASIGQVHIGYIKEEKVAIKILKPGTRVVIKKDFKFLVRLLTIAEIIPQFRKLRLKEIFSEFKTWTLRELNYRIEAINTDKFAETYKDNQHLKVPKVFNEYTSKNILVTEFIEGVTAKKLINKYSTTSKKEVEIDGILFSRDKLLNILGDIAYSQVFVHGFIHGDPHLSNIIFVDSEKVCFIDFGVVGTVNEIERKLLEEIIYFSSIGKLDKVVENLMKLDRFEGSESAKIIEQKIKPMYAKYQSSTPLEYSATEFLLNTLYHVGQLGIEPPLTLVIIGKVLASYDTAIQILNPKTTIVEEAASYFNQRLTKNIAKEFNKESLLLKSFNSFKSLKELMDGLPEEFGELFESFKKDGIKVTTRSEYNTTLLQKQKILWITVFIWVFSFLAFLVSIFTEMEVSGFNMQLFFLGNWIVTTLITLYKIMIF